MQHELAKKRQRLLKKKERKKLRLTESKQTLERIRLKGEKFLQKDRQLEPSDVR